MLRKLLAMWPGNIGFQNIQEWAVYVAPKYIRDQDGERICRYCSAYPGDCGC